MSAPQCSQASLHGGAKSAGRILLRTESRPKWECILRMLVHSATHVCTHVWVVLKARGQFVSACALIRVQAHRIVFGLQVCVEFGVVSCTHAAHCRVPMHVQCMFEC